MPKVQRNEFSMYKLMFRHFVVRFFCIITRCIFIISFSNSALFPKGTCKSDRSRQERSNEYLAANFGAGTAENESYKSCQR